MDAHVDRLMGEVGGEAIDYGAGAEEYVRRVGGGGGGGGGGSGGFCNMNRKRSHDQMLAPAEFLPRPTDYLQAFSHFSYHYSQRKMLVCDLQGVMSHNSPGSSCAGVFELTGKWWYACCEKMLPVLQVKAGAWEGQCVRPYSWAWWANGSPMLYFFVRILNVVPGALLTT